MSQLCSHIDDVSALDGLNLLYSAKIWHCWGHWPSDHIANSYEILGHGGCCGSY